MQNIKLIIHDWDDTITNSFKTYSSWYWDFANFNKISDPDFDTLRKAWGAPVPKLFKYAWPHLSQEESQKYQEAYNASSTKEYIPKIFEGAEATLRNLNTVYDLAIISSGQSEKLKRMIKLHLTDFIDEYKFLLCSEDCLYHKPDPRVFDAIPDDYKNTLDVSEILYIGDSLIDYYAARDKGISFIAVTTGVVTREDFTESGLDTSLILERFEEIQSLLL